MTAKIEEKELLSWLNNTLGRMSRVGLYAISSVYRFALENAANEARGYQIKTDCPNGCGGHISDALNFEAQEMRQADDNRGTGEARNGRTASNDAGSNAPCA